MKVAAYVRVSQEDQHEENQITEITRWLEANGIASADVVWFVDRASGKDTERPQFSHLDRRVSLGRFDIVVVWKLDRLSRSIRDGVNVLHRWVKSGIRLVSVTQNIDFSGAIGEMIASLLFGVAQMEREHMLERQAVGIKRARAEGKYQGRRPGTTKARPERARALISKGLTVEETSRTLGVTQMTVYRYLRMVESV